MNALAPAVFHFGGNVTIDSGNAESGDQVSGWTDLTGGGRHATQSTQHDEPTLVADGADSALSFDLGDGTDGDALSIPGSVYALSGKSAATVIVAVKYPNPIPTSYIFDHRGSDVAFALAMPAGTAVRAYMAGANYVTSGVAPVPGSRHVYAVVFDGSLTGNQNRLKIYDGNAQMGSMTDAGTVPASVQSLSSGSLGRYLGGGVGWGGLMYCYIAFSRALSDADRNEAHEILKYALDWYS